MTSTSFDDQTAPEPTPAEEEAWRELERKQCEQGGAGLNHLPPPSLRTSGHYASCLRRFAAIAPEPTKREVLQQAARMIDTLNAELERQQRGEPVAWTLTQQQVVTLAEELIAGASTMGGMDDDGIESDVRLLVLMPGMSIDDDGKANERPILGFCLDDYPEEGNYPIDPTDCKPTYPQPTEPVANSIGYIEDGKAILTHGFGPDGNYWTNGTRIYADPVAKQPAQADHSEDSLEMVTPANVVRSDSNVGISQPKCRELDALSAENARLRAALRWTAGTMQAACSLLGPIDEDSPFMLGDETRTVAQILDAADAALQESQS